MTDLAPSSDQTGSPAAGPGGARTVLNAAVVVAALGYFVDIYDLVLFGVVRVQSLKALGYSDDVARQLGAELLTWQMLGMLVGGIIFGVIGDKKGRLHILFGSITLYSVATLANAWVPNIGLYKVLRFVAGLGLAGELGAGVTLVAEILPARLRGYGTMLVATVGVSGAVAANQVARLGWRTAFVVGGALGLVLLLLRIRVHESAMFRGLERVASVSRGNFLALFTKWSRFRTYLLTILVGIPPWFVVGVLMTFSNDLAKALEVTGPIAPGDAIQYCYLGLVAGDFASGMLSQAWGSRRKVVILFVLLSIAGTAAYFVLGRGASPGAFLAICFALGLASGYWAIFVTMGAEQCGTNLRATVATTVPNFVRGAVALIVPGFVAASHSLGVLRSAMVVGAACLGVALVSAFRLRETFGVDLDYVEQD